MEKFAKDYRTTVKIAQSMIDTLREMNLSEVSQLELQRSDPPTPYELQLRALRAVLELLTASPSLVYDMLMDSNSVEYALGWAEENGD